MTEFGTTLREAREKKGLTISQIAEQTHLLPQIVEDMENEDFHRISAPIYGRGFVKLYCEAVGLEAKPLVDEFMAILNGERAPAIRMKEVELPAEPPPPPPPPPPPVYTQPEFGEEPAGESAKGQVEVEAKVEEKVVRQEIRDASGDFRPETRAETFGARPEPRQYRPDYAHATPPFAPLPFNIGRMLVLVLGALAILAGLFFGVRAVYRASMGIPAGDESKPKVEVEEKSKSKVEVEAKAKTETKSKSKVEGEAKAKPTTKTPRKIKTIAPLYID